jgi:predicted HNH restriction endonuclease
MTAKMHAFASNIVQGMSPSDAYRRAYDCSNMSEASIVSDANRLLKDARITQLLESFWVTLKENVIADHQATRRHIMSQLFDHAERAGERTSDKLKALELMGRAIGMFTDKVESKVEEVNVDSLKKELESSLALLQTTKSKPLLN